MYCYKTEREKLFSDEGQRTFLRVRDNVQGLINKAGAVRMQEAALELGGDSWELMACVDRMVELGELKEISHPDCFGQDRIFTV